MAQASEISDVIAVPEDRAARSGENHLPVLKWVVAVMVAAIAASLGGGIWALQEALARHPELAGLTPGELLFGPTSKGTPPPLSSPLLITAAALCFLVYVGVYTVRSWARGILSASAKVQAGMEHQIEEVESRLNLAHASAEFWKSHARKADERTGNAEASRQELERRMGQLAIREQQLAREQEALSRSKDRLEKHVEARTVELHRLQQRYISILNSAGEGICSFDLEGRLTFANPAAASMMGWEQDEWQGMKSEEVFADYGGGSAVTKSDEPDPGESSHPAPVIFRRKDSILFPVEIVRTPVEENGRKIGTVLIFKDVTERTEADERFSAKVAELARSNSELEQFAFVASHDLQEPLRKIQAFGDRLKTRMGDGLTPEATDYLTRMQSAAARMQGLIDGLLMYSRVLTRAQPYTRIELQAVVREVMEDLEVRIEKSGAVVEAENLPAIEADAVQIRQLLQNLIGNALKFQAPGNKPHVKVSARILPQGQAKGEGSGNTEIFSRIEMCELTVADNGIGFDESYLNRLFVVFQRLHSRSEFEGTGIGLAVCRKIANRHGGSITAKSRLGEGSEFVVLLPLRQCAERGGLA